MHTRKKQTQTTTINEIEHVLMETTNKQTNTKDKHTNTNTTNNEQTKAITTKTRQPKERE